MIDKRKCDKRNLKSKQNILAIINVFDDVNQIKEEGVGGKQRRIPIGHVGVCLSIDSNTPSTYRNVH